MRHHEPRLSLGPGSALGDVIAEMKNPKIVNDSIATQLTIDKSKKICVNFIKIIPLKLSQT